MKEGKLTLVSEIWKCAMVIFSFVVTIMIAKTEKGATEELWTPLTTFKVGNAHSVSLFAAFLTDINSPRIPQLKQYIESWRKPDNFGFEYWFVNWTTYNDTNLHSLYPPPQYRRLVGKGGPGMKKHYDLGAKLYFVMHFFLENSTAGWFYRGTDDSIIFFNNLVPYFNYLESRFNPYKDEVIFGNCLEKTKVTYLQGGSGYLMSRIAAERLVLTQDEFFNTRLNEDYLVSVIMHNHGMSFINSTSEFFLGHGFNETVLRKIDGNSSSLPRCPEDVANSTNWHRCRAFKVPLCDIVFLHTTRIDQANLSLQFRLAEIYQRASRHHMWWVDGFMPVLCFSEQVFERIY